jgi:restriction system protein
MIERGIQVFERTLRLYESPDGRSGRQFATTGSVGIIDILAEDLNSGDLVVIELKKDKGVDEIIGQLSRYRGWVREKLAKPGQGVVGIVCVRESSEKLRLAASDTNIDVRTYGFSFHRG